jgi:transposase
MSKKEASGEYAQRLYVVHGTSLQDIAAKLKISYRTLQNWKKEGCWDAERQRLKEAEGATHSSFYAELATELRLLRAETGEGKEVDIARYKRIEILTNSMGKVLDYESKVPKKTERKKSSEEVMAELGKIMWGEN